MKAYRNNELGLRGVSQITSGRFHARIRVKRRLIVLGTFDTGEQAHAAWLAAHEQRKKGTLQ